MQYEILQILQKIMKSKNSSLREAADQLFEEIISQISQREQ